MIAGTTLLAIGAAVCVTEVAMGAYVSTHAERLVGATGRLPAPLRKVGRAQMIAGPVILLIFAALAFGLIPAASILPIAI